MAQKNKSTDWNSVLLKFFAVANLIIGGYQLISSLTLSTYQSFSIGGPVSIGLALSYLLTGFGLFKLRLWSLYTGAAAVLFELLVSINTNGFNLKSIFWSGDFVIGLIILLYIYSQRKKLS